MGLVPDQRDDHAVEVEKEHDQVEPEFDERLLLVPIQGAENFGSIQEVCIVEDLLDIESKQRQVQNQSDPVSVDQEQQSQEGVDGGFGDDVGVKTVAQVDRVDVIAFEVRVHYCEKDL